MVHSGISVRDFRKAVLSMQGNNGLLQSALNAIVKTGNEVRATRTTKLPFRLQIWSDSELLSVRIYLWELEPFSDTHYEIRIRGINRFEPLRSGKTLVLGWWKELNLFAGFDVREHLGNLSQRSSIRIREAALWKADMNGLDVCYKGNKEVAVVFRPDFFVEYVKRLEPLHDFGRSLKDLAVLNQVAENPQINEINIKNGARKAVIIFVSKKLRDIVFRRGVLANYDFRCAFCGTFEHVEAVHIIPVNHERSTNEIRNGLALCVRHREAYDNGLITVMENYSVQINRARIRRLQKPSDKLATRGLRPIIILPPTILDRPHAEYIRIANHIRGWK